MQSKSFQKKYKTYSIERQDEHFSPEVKKHGRYCGWRIITKGKKDCHLLCSRVLNDNPVHFFLRMNIEIAVKFVPYLNPSYKKHE